MRTAPLWIIVTTTTRFVTAVFDSWPLKTGPIGCPETSVRNYHNTLRNSPEERSSNILAAEAWIQEKCYLKKLGNLTVPYSFWWNRVDIPRFAETAKTFTDGPTPQLLILS